MVLIGLFVSFFYWKCEQLSFILIIEDTGSVSFCLCYIIKLQIPFGWQLAWYNNYSQYLRII